MTERGLPLDLLFEEDGHVSDVCVTAVADGEIALVPQVALDHLDACDACGARLGEAALLAATAHAALFGAPREAANGTTSRLDLAPASPRRSQRPLPIAAIAVALLVAVITASPAVADAVMAVPEVVKAAIGWAPTLLRVAANVAWSGPSLGPTWIAVKGLSAVMFVLTGLSLARWTARRRSAAIEGGVR